VCAAPTPRPTCPAAKRSLTLGHVPHTQRSPDAPARSALPRTAPAFVAGLTLVLAACAGHPGPQTAAAGSSPLQMAVLRAGQAPIVGLPDVLTSDTILGKRVRVLGWCASAPGLLAGRRSGAWMMATPDTTIEVRGSVPSACGAEVIRQELVLVFAQVVPAVRGGRERLLLRLPD
jgi:hypothetical protein